MSQPEKMIRIEKNEAGVCVAKLLPRKILDELLINEIGQQIGDLIEQGSSRLVIDFHQVDHLSSAALGMLITVRQSAVSAGGAVCLCNIQSDIFQVFKITGLDKLFSIHPSVADATTSLRS